MVIGGVDGLGDGLGLGAGAGAGGGEPIGTGVSETGPVEFCAEETATGSGGGGEFAAVVGVAAGNR